MYGIFMKAGSFIKTGIIKKVSPNYFTGKASLQIISGTPKPKEADVLHVKFHKGARTKIHAHTSGQMLIVTGGTGSLITYSGNSKKIPFKVKIKEKIPSTCTFILLVTKDHQTTVHLNTDWSKYTKEWRFTNKMKVFGQSMSASFGRIMGNLQTKTKVMPRCKMRTRMKN